MSLTLSTGHSPFPYAALALAVQAGKQIVWDQDATQPTIDGIVGEDAIIDALAAGSASPASDSASAALAANLARATAFPDIVAALDALDDRLALRTYLVGRDLGPADWRLWGVIKGNLKLIGALKSGRHAHLARWFAHIDALPAVQEAVASLASAKSTKARTNKTAAGFALGLEGAEMGKVKTRFPPEPSGYLHIGHAKAALLNQYFARMYQGEMGVRFDDTNPTKETAEFEDTILEDLKLLGVEVSTSSVTHTSDYFPQLVELCEKAIKEGKAYADDTEQMRMRQERFDGVASVHRDDDPASSLARFEDMKAGTEEGSRWCIRAKISVDDNNKAMRDPVIYRVNLLPHHRTGTTYKAYPTYDFACPIVDSLEGVTHALRTNEYRDRNPQYQWMITALGLREVRIWDFSRLNFIYTLLSKRKLHWFVNEKLVRGWDDPRFPTVRGIRRRGMTVEALRQFMLAQGPSQAIVSLEWDTIWAMNKKIIDPIAPRFWAVEEADLVPASIINFPGEAAEVKVLPRHKKNAEVGEKRSIYWKHILLEQVDAHAVSEGEETTLMDWGNAIVKRKVEEGGKVTSVELELHLEGDVKKTKLKTTWLSASPDNTLAPPAGIDADLALVPTTLLDFDYLITKKKMEEGDDVKDFVTPQTEFRVPALADGNVRTLNKGDIIQFERKGYYIYDGEGADGRREFIHIPDGRAAGIASKAAVEEPKKAGKAKGDAKSKPAPKADKKAAKNAEAAAATKKAAAAKTDAPGTVAGVDSVTSMYKAEKIYGDDLMLAPGEASNMYEAEKVYEA
ncbi:tRNA synthetases class I, catalytic domain-containing protein [Schizophyllum amplum]|uniref:glutamate--tRNA ligase n=1 Tax=Schizophyllum amplum TaxID=97359 RepID=A0A550CXC5_9AGAR|nr:tRNA synthetases class I, catalytic domain-containing protein [Auriculariopsis ampla]